ncbi:MAG: ABC transporter permease [Bacillales bacterium]|nr:ABC transporter permease [Bacillales bacterium]
MRSKLDYLITLSLKRKMKTKWFLITNILVAILIIGLINIDSIITLFGGDFNKKTKLYVIDNTNEAYELFKTELDNSSKLLNEESSYEVYRYDKTIDDAMEELKEKDNYDNYYLEFSYLDDYSLKVKLVTKEYIDIYDTQILNNALNNTKVSLSISHSNISIEELNKIYEPVNVDRVYLDEKKNSAEENMEMIMSSVFPIIILPVFMLIVFLVQMIGAEINDEKTSKSMEIIISNVSAKTHFAAKVIAGNVFVISQSLLLLLYGSIGLFLRKIIGGSNIVSGITGKISSFTSEFLSSSVGTKLVYAIPIFIVILLATFVAYSLIAGILASMSTNVEDFQQVQTPIIIVLLLSYYLSMMAGLFNGSIFIKVVSMIPFISAILAPALFMLGEIGVFGLSIASVLLIITDYLLIKYGMKIYKVGILNYSSSKLFKKMFKALKD